MMKNNWEYIYNSLEHLYPNAHCQLDHKNNFELTVAVVLSAQTTDISVNKISGTLFKRYPDAFALANADLEEVETIIKPIGLYKNKSKNIIALSKELVDRFDGIVPDNMEDLVSLPGVGRKSANVILSECFNYPAIAVDTHVSRIAKRLKIATVKDDVTVIEKKLMRYFPKDKWSRVHHLFIFFGRYKCYSRNPDCSDCPFEQFCRKEFN